MRLVKSPEWEECCLGNGSLFCDFKKQNQLLLTIQHKQNQVLQNRLLNSRVNNVELSGAYQP